MPLDNMVEENSHNTDVSSASDKEQDIKTRDNEVSATSSPVIHAGPVDADMGRHIIEGIEIQFPEFMEFSLLGKNRNYFRVNSLRQLQSDIQQLIENLSGNKGFLPGAILEKLASLKNSKDKRSVFNYFGTFIEEYIHFRQRNYDGNTSGQKILSDRNRQQQGLATDKDKHKQQTDLLASRLSGYLAQTFALLMRLRETDLSSWRDTENRARDTLIKRLPLPEFHALNLRGPLTENSQSGKILAGQKLNNLIHAETWKERGLRQKSLATTAGGSDRAETNGADELTGFGALLDKEPDDPADGVNTASLTGELALLLQGIKLTRSAALKLTQKGDKASLSGRELNFLTYITGSCEKLTALVSEMHSVVENAVPANDLLRDSPERKFAENLQNALASAWQAITTHAPFIFRPAEQIAWRAERVLTAQFTEKTDRLKDALGMHTLTEEEKSAVLQAGGIVKDLLQQAMANIQRIHLAARPLSEALQHQATLKDLLAAGETQFLDDALRQQRVFWQTTVAEEQTALESFIEKTAVLSRGGDHDNLKRLIREVLSTDAQSSHSADALKGFFVELNGHINYLTALEKEEAKLPDTIVGSAQKNQSLSAIFTPWLKQMEEVRSLLNAQISQLAGREPASFSRSGMLAKGIAVWHQERKAQWLQNQPAEGQEERGKQYDAAFQTLIKNYLPLLAKQHDRQGDVLLQRIKTEMVNAEVGTTLYPTTMAEMLHTQKGMAGVLQNSAIRSLVRLGISAIFGSVGVLPSLAALPLRIVIRSLLTGARLAYVSRKGAAGVRLGEGSARLEARQYRQTAVSQVVAKTALGLVKPVREAAGLVSLLYEIYQGDATGAAVRVARELPAELGMSGMAGAVKAVVLAHIARQSAEENEQTREALQRLSEEISATDDDADAEPIATTAEAGEEVATALEAIVNHPDGPAGPQRLAVTLLKQYRAQRAAGEPPLRLERLSSVERSQFSYNRSGGVISLRADAEEQEVLHEIAHALTARRLDEGLRNPDSEAGQACAELASLRAAAAAAWQARGEVPPELAYYLGEREDTEVALHEFVAGVYSDAALRTFLAGINTEGESLWTRVTGWLCELLGIEREAISALFAAEQAGEKLLGQALTENTDEGRELYWWSYNPDKGVFEYEDEDEDEQDTAYITQDWENWHGSSVASSGDRASLVTWLGTQSKIKRNLWFKNSTLPPEYKQDLRILVAENYFIYEGMVSGDEYVKWISDFKQWPADFQSNNRIVGVLRDPETDKSFPKGKGMLFILNDSEGNIVFSKIYYPQDMGEEKDTSGTWQKNILSQIEADMQAQPESNRVSVVHINGYDSQHPTIATGTGDGFNFFKAEGNSRASSADIRFIDIEPKSQNQYNNINQAESAGVDTVLIEKAAEEGLIIKQEDLDKKYHVKFRSQYITPFLRTELPDSSLQYTLRQILLGEPFRHEEINFSSMRAFINVIGMNQFTRDKINNITTKTQLSMTNQLKTLRENEEFRSSNISDFEKRTNNILLGLYLDIETKPEATEDEQEVSNMINDYSNGKLNISLVDLTMPRNHTLGPMAGLSTYPVPGVLALVGPKMTIYISLTNNTYVTFPSWEIYNPRLVNFINAHLSLFNRGDVHSTFKTEWRLSFNSSGNNNTDDTDNIFSSLLDRYMDSIESNVDYAIFTTAEQRTQFWTEKAQTALRVLAAVATVATLTASGNPYAAIGVGMLIEVADIAMTAVQVNNADRPETYRAAKNELLVQAILFAVFNVTTVRDLLKIASTRPQQYLAAARMAREDVASNIAAKQTGRRPTPGSSDFVSTRSPGIADTTSQSSRNVEPNSSSSGYSSGSNRPGYSESRVNTRAASTGGNAAAPRQPALPHREPVMPRASKADLSDAETAVIDSTKEQLRSSMGGQYDIYQMRPKENCANAAKDVAIALKLNGYTDVKMHELGIWRNGRTNTIPVNHYVVMAKKDGVDIVVDLTAGQFERYDLTGAIISTKNNWLSKWQEAMAGQPQFLVKLAPVRGGTATSPFGNFSSYNDAQITVPNGTLLQSPAWYSSVEVNGANAVSHTTINTSTVSTLSGTPSGSGQGSGSINVNNRLASAPPTNYSTATGSTIRTVHQAMVPTGENASNTMQQSTNLPGSTDSAQRLVVHRGVSENSPHTTERNGWRPLTSIDRSDFDLHPGECIEYRFSYVRNSQKTTISGRVRIPADQRNNRKWHTYFSQQLNHIINGDDALLGVFNVQHNGHGGGGSSNLNYLDPNSHYNAVYASENSEATEQEFTWNILAVPT
ncbi:hypothetical protein [Candidatus Pantoea multigeneris]|uniref:Tox-PLDMTX domain-containing protein n=1 Tax=Candidatus Pantoea multigeneris TaxID=2608357 RepID=A0ABX0R9S6_9GAMM|nr:hypothetical protein [Pantoea multigeneris]NIF20005.1 hypothetical protein [Pantoea multigeneris]